MVSSPDRDSEATVGASTGAAYAVSLGTFALTSAHLDPGRAAVLGTVLKRSDLLARRRGAMEMDCDLGLAPPTPLGPPPPAPTLAALRLSNTAAKLPDARLFVDTRRFAWH